MRDRAGQAMRRCRVVADHVASFADPLAVRAGEPLVLSGKRDEWQGRPDWLWLWATDPRGKSGWAPAAYLDVRGSQATARMDYDASELSVATGAELAFLNGESGWCWCADQRGRHGWVPLANLACADEEE